MSKTNTAAAAAAAPTLVATRDFTDAGTEKAFIKGQPVEVSPATLANYRAAGLVAERTDDAADTAA